MKPCFINEFANSDKYKNNEEYKKHLRNINRIFLLLSIVGALIAALGFSAEFLADKIGLTIRIDDYMLGLYCGAGCGLVIAGILMQIRNRNIMKDEKKLTERRREQKDERLQEIGKRAVRTATLVMIIAMYAILLVGGLFYPVLTTTMSVLICLFLVTYCISYTVLQHKS